ncbi:MAG: hypothetical protein H5T62_10135 [Anaerolineae bacterium]|nr:hypothetical protein [Anaerolineae bacterium]
MASPRTVEVTSLPQSIEQFIALRNQVAHTPEGGAAVFILALLTYTLNEELGRQCLVVAIDREWLQEGSGGYRGQQLRLTDMRRIQTQLKNRSYLPRSYIRGALPENGYQLPVPPYTLQFVDNPYSGDHDSGTYKVFVVSSGATSPRPIRVRRNKQGVWKAYEWSSLIVGVREPVQDIRDEL